MDTSNFILCFTFAITFQSFYCLTSGYDYVTDYFQVPLDHFSFAVNKTLKLRYLYNNAHWRKAEKGPIFFYTGNEGNVESFANNTGFMWDIAEEFGAALVFAEHRFYGKSFPNDSSSVIGYLTVEQVLADFAKLITGLKRSWNANSSPVISFGGSYGGQLTAYLRIKYPHIVQGGIASSAPLFLFDSNCELHDKVLTSVFGSYSPTCVPIIRQSWNSINKITSSDKGKAWLTTSWKLCDPLRTADQVTSLKSWLQTMYYTVGMVNYPYPANFMQDLPAFPVKEFCLKVTTDVSQLENNKNADELQLEKLFRGINLYFNYSGTTTCFDYNNIDETSISFGFSDMDNESFNYQSCTELMDPSCDDGVNDFFEPEPWDFAGFVASCQQEYGVTPKPELLEFFYGGQNILSASNILFSNGLLDPWYANGVLKNLSDSLLALVIEDAAHHLDLRASHPMDPPAVIAAREFEKTLIRKWIVDFHETQARLIQLFS